MTQQLKPASPHSAALFGLAAFAVFATHDVIVKHLGATYSAIQIVFFGALLSFPLITFLMIRDAEPGTLRPRHPWWLALRSVSGTLSAVCTFFALGLLPLSQVYAVLFAAPLLITLMAIPILGETVRLRRGIAIVIGLIGVLIVLRPGSEPLGLGQVMALMGAFLGALNAIVVRKIGQEERPVLLVLYPMMANFILTAAVLPFVYVPVPITDLGLFAVVAALVLVAMSALVAAYRRGDAMVVAPMQYSQIIWATIFGVVLFNETPELNTYVGAAVIVVSGLYIIRRESTGDVSRNTPVLETRTRIGIPTGLRVGALLRKRRGDGS